MAEVAHLKRELRKLIKEEYNKDKYNYIMNEMAPDKALNFISNNKHWFDISKDEDFTIYIRKKKDILIIYITTCVHKINLDNNKDYICNKIQFYYKSKSLNLICDEYNHKINELFESELIKNKITNLLKSYL